MSILSPLADACPQCPPGDHPAVLPFLVTRERGSLRAWYGHGPCGRSWECWWDPEAAGWPLHRVVPAPAPPEPPARCEGCGYLVTAPGHLVTCGTRGPKPGPINHGTNGGHEAHRRRGEAPVPVERAPEPLGAMLDELIGTLAGLFPGADQDWPVHGMPSESGEAA